jgi:integrase/recombinase XerD
MNGLSEHLEDYLRLRRSLGHQMAEAAWLLPDFVAFMGQRGQSTVTIQAVLAWVRLREDEVVTTVSPRRVTAIRGFARYLSGIDPDTEIPPLGLVPHRQRWRPPFLYSDADIAVLLAAAEAIEPRRRRVPEQSVDLSPPTSAAARLTAPPTPILTMRKSWQ